MMRTSRRHDTTVVDPPPCQTTSKPKICKPKAKKNTPKKHANETDLIRVANEIELSEIDSAFHAVSPTKRKCVGSIVKGALLALDQDNEVEPSPVKRKTNTCLCRSEMETLKTKCTGLSEEISTMWAWIGLLDKRTMPASTPTPVYQYHERTTPTPYQGYSGRNGTFSALLSDQGMTSYTSTASSMDTQSISPLSPSPSTSSEPTFGGFTKSQLLAETAGVKDFSKAAKRLFRRLYKESEYEGRTLTGGKPNRHYEGRPQLEDLSKLEVIYEIMEEEYKVTRVQVRDKLRDLLKPCRHSQPGLFDPK